MSIEYNEQTLLHTPALTFEQRGEVVVALDGDGPNWIATDARGAHILRLLDGKTPLREVVRSYGQEFRTDLGKAFVHVDSFARAAARSGVVSSRAFHRAAYLGRSHYLRMNGLSEFWIHINDRCNLACSHCLVESSPKHPNKGLETFELKRLVDEAVDLGVSRFYITGGEPLLREDIFDLLEHITRNRDREAAVLTNGILFGGDTLRRLAALDPERISLQVSLDGSRPEVNDPIRGPGSFDRIVKGIDSLGPLGFRPTVTTVLVNGNLEDSDDMVRFASSLGAEGSHFLWPHRRGRAMEGEGAAFPSPGALLASMRPAARAAAEADCVVDNIESLRGRVDGRPGLKYDLGTAAWTSLCLSSDGHIYPSAALAGHPGLDCGDAREEGIGPIWRNGRCGAIRGLSLVQMESARSDPFRFLTGGGDMEHIYLYNEELLRRRRPDLGRSGQEPRRELFLGSDPYGEVTEGLMLDLLFELAGEGAAAVNRRSGFDAPVIFRRMGQDRLCCGAEEDEAGEVGVLRSACVLSYEVKDRSREAVSQFYTRAAEAPQADLCCPTSYPAEDVDHIPREVVERFYGCGSPVNRAGLREGETVLDLGSGAGIDCFIAARKVGPAGRAIGVDMTDAMLEVALENRPKVAERLGFENVEFKKGYLEEVPVEDATADVIMSNCVINLSPDKKRVFAEIWRVLRDHGRFVISDIVSETEVPPTLRLNQHLWGECIGGALSEDELFSSLEEAGFYGLRTIAKSAWKTVEGVRFFSVTVQGYKYEKKAGCVFIGQRAVYTGPFKAVVDEEGHTFPRGEEVEVCTDTAAKLRAEPYSGRFIVIDPEGGAEHAPASYACEPGCC